MAIEASVPFSDGWWLVKLEDALVRRREGRGWGRLDWDRKGRPPLKLLSRYLDGDPPLPEVAFRWEDGMREFLRKARMNYCEVVVDTVAHKMNPLGVRTAAQTDRNGDSLAAAIFTANQMDLAFTDVTGDMLALGDGYMIAGPPEGDLARLEQPLPLITSESPYEVITAEDTARRRPRAALKLSVDEWGGDEFAYIYKPGYVRVAKRSPSQRGAGSWDWFDELSVKFAAGLQDLLPVRRFQNRRGLGEFEPHLDVIDRINDGIFDRIMIAKYQAFRQRAVKNLPDEDPETGEKMDYSGVFTASPGDFWQVPEGVDFWESQPIDLGPVRLAIKDDVQAFAAATSTALHLFSPDAAQGSAEGATLVREGGTWKAEDRKMRANHPLIAIIAAGFRFVGEDARADISKMKTIWSPSERFSVVEKYAAAVQAKLAGEPFVSYAQNVLQYTPDDIEWMESLRADDLLFGPVGPGEGSAALQAAGLAASQPPAGQQNQPQPQAGQNAG